MKKFLSVVLSACMALTFAGCGAGQDGKAVYDAANKKTQELTALDEFVKANFEDYGYEDEAGRGNDGYFQQHGDEDGCH